ncbi:MAG: glycoside hydrolase family 76 protein [Solirubrobacteraceae bacterium]
MKLVDRYWPNARFHWYNGLLKDPKPYPQASIWDAVPVFESLDQIALAAPTSGHIAAVVRFANHAEIYWDPVLKPGPGYVPYPGGRGTHTKTYFDDNSVWGLAFMDAYRATGNKRYLADAKRAMDFVIAYAWDAKDGGGLWWNTYYPRRHSEVLAMATDLAARIYQATGTPLYLQTALKYTAWANQHLLKWDGSYAAQVPNVQLMPHDGEGAMVDAFTTLCEMKANVPASLYDRLPPNSVHRNPSLRRPSDPTSWCSWAQSVARKTAFGVNIGGRTFDRYMPLNDGPQYDAIYVRGLLSLYSLDHNRTWYKVAATAARRFLKNSADSAGRFLKNWNGSTRVPGADPGMLRTHAASVSVLAALAATPPPS